MTKSQTVNYVSLVIAGVCFGSIPVFSYYLSLLGVSSLQQALFRILFTVLYLFISIAFFLRFRGLKLRREHVLPFALYGLFGVSSSIIAYLSAIAIGTPVVVAVSLTYLYPALTAIIARLFLKESLNRIRLIAIPLSIVGAVIVSVPLNIDALSLPFAGILFSIANAIFAAVYVVLGRKWGSHEGYASLITTFWGYAFGALWMGPIILVFHILVSDPRIVGFQFFLPPIIWLLLFGFALIATTIPYTLTNFGVKNIDASAASIILLLDPISAVIMSFLFLHQPVAFWQFLGATLILFATILIALEPKVMAKRKRESEIQRSKESAYI